MEAVLEIVRNIQNIRLIIIDTLHRNSTGDENSSKDFATILKQCDELRLATGATIMLVHHSGHGDKNRSRGSSSIKGGIDTEFQVSQTNGVIKLHCNKMKDDEKPKDIKFDLKPVTLGYDEDGKAITAPILDKSTTFFAADKPSTINPTDKLTLDILSQLSGDNGTSVSKADWKAACMEKYTVTSSSENPDEARRKKFDRCLKSLLNKGFIVEDNECFTIAGSDVTTEEEKDD